MNLDSYKKNPKTSYLAERYEALVREEQGLLDMAKKDERLKEMADEDLTALRAESKNILEQMETIARAEKIEEELPNEVILEVRAGAGGEEAALFAEELALMYQKYSERREIGRASCRERV